MIVLNDVMAIFHNVMAVFNDVMAVFHYVMVVLNDVMTAFHSRALEYSMHALSLHV